MLLMKNILLINDKQNYLRLKESIRLIDSQLGNIEQDRSIEHCKMLKKNKHKDSQSLNLKPKV